jgi:hypothetical protein
MKTELHKFYTLIDEIKIAMMTTRRPDGHLESRAMANQKRCDGADLWFVTAEGSDKLRTTSRAPTSGCRRQASPVCRVTVAKSTSSTSLIGRCGLDRRVIRGTEPSMILALS